LNGEIRHLSAKIPNKTHSHDKELNHIKDIQQEDCANIDILDDMDTYKAVKRPETPSEQNELN